MKTRDSQNFLIFIVAAILCLDVPSVIAQTSEIPWSAFTTGFGASASTSTSVTSAAGQTFVGTSNNGVTAIASGFLANPSLFGPITAVIDEQAEAALPTTYELQQNYPNPFNPSTVISFELPASSYVTLKVFDVNGREVATLVDGNLAAGKHAVTFAPRDVASGIYFYKLTAGKFSQTRKAVFVK